MPNLEVPPLSADQVAVLIRTLVGWAERHPRRNDPLIAFADGTALSPAALVEEVAARNRNGEAFLRMVRCGLETASFEEILGGFASRFEQR